MKNCKKCGKVVPAEETWQHRCDSESTLNDGLYRLIRIGEVVEEGDEHLMDDCINWEPVNRWVIGNKYSEVLQPIRRAG